MTATMRPDHVSGTADRPVSKDPLARLAERQTLTAPLEEPLQEAVRSAFDVFGEDRQAVRNALHGTWLNEPLHAILVEIPVGSWTGTVIFDALAALGAGGDKMDYAADATLVLGMAGAVGAAVTGLNDWAETDGAPRRIGMVHALLNTLSLGILGWSWWERRRSGNRTAARWLAAFGYVVVSASAHLGGNLVYEHGVGVQDEVPLS